MALPEFFIMGAPKAGTTALHAALAHHPALFLSGIKEPKFYLCDGRRPDPGGQRGPGDAHSAREWVWDRRRYEALFDAAPAEALRGESTPFYLYDRGAHLRIHADVPDARLVLVLRDPVDRAYSNWMHLWSDGLEPIPDFLTALEAEDERVAAGFAPFWHYRRLGLYGEQLEHLYSVFDREQIHVLRYRDLIDDPRQALGRVCRFLGVHDLDLGVPRPENVRSLVPDRFDKRTIARTMRAGAWAGQFAPPQVWRRASTPLLAALHSGGVPRPHLTPAQRQVAIAGFASDIGVLEHVTGGNYADWLHGPGRGAFGNRKTTVDLTGQEAHQAPRD